MGRSQQARGKPASNISVPVFLEAGHEYFIEVLMKGDAGYTAHAEVAWLKPGDPPLANGSPPISGEYLSAAPAVGPISIYQAPASQAVATGAATEFSVGVWGAPPYFFQWFANGQPIPDSTNETYRIAAASRELSGIAYTVAVSNLLGGVVTAPVVLNVNTPPVLLPIANRPAKEGALFALVPTATDPDQPPNNLTWSLDAGAPTGMKIDAITGVVFWTPDETHGGQTITVTVTVTGDGVPPLSASQSFTINVVEVNSAPKLAAISDQTVDEEKELTFTVTATDDDLPAQALTFSLVEGSAAVPAAPAGVSPGGSDGAPISDPALTAVPVLAGSETGAPAARSVSVHGERQRTAAFQGAGALPFKRHR